MITHPSRTSGSAGLHYIAVGDSYTAGTGALPGEDWPTILADDLTENGTPTKLVANPAKSGFTTADAIKFELGKLPKKADLATLMIGANDWVQERSPDEFRNNLKILIENLKERVPRGRLYVITIPDFSFAPGKFYAGGRNITQGIASFNEIITQEAAAAGVNIIDIFPASQRMPESFYAIDGLHPNGKGYAEWEKIIFEAVYDQLRKGK